MKLSDTSPTSHMPLVIVIKLHVGSNPGGGGTPINRVYGDDPLDRVWFLDFFVIDRVSILRFVSSRFEFLVIDRVLLLLTGLACKHYWSLFHRLKHECVTRICSFS